MPTASFLPREQITGLLLAGGMGRRMGGADKGLLAFDGRPMAAQVLKRLRPQVGSVLINANRSLDEWQQFGERVVSDAIGGFAGPLAGVHAGLLACTSPWLATAPCDSPYLPLDLVEHLSHAIISSPDTQLAVARCNGQLHPVFALMQRDLLPDLEQYLQAGERKIDRWFSRLRIAIADFPDPEAFANINTPEELAGPRITP